MDYSPPKWAKMRVIGQKCMDYSPPTLGKKRVFDKNVWRFWIKMHGL